MNNKILDNLKYEIFDNGNIMLSPEINSVNSRNLTHQDTEILGMFCDFMNVHGDDLKEILLRGYLNKVDSKE